MSALPAQRREEAGLQRGIDKSTRTILEPMSWKCDLLILPPSHCCPLSPVSFVYHLQPNVSVSMHALFLTMPTQGMYRMLGFQLVPFLVQPAAECSQVHPFTRISKNREKQEAHAKSASPLRPSVHKSAVTYDQDLMDCQHTAGEA